ncbi:MAG: YcxB family protein [Anaerolineales bacterium]|nr:YcxB family protein [Anaerolineales bacterium]
MEIEYYLDKDDMMDVALYQFNQSLEIRKRIIKLRIWYTIGFLLLAVGCWIMEGELVFPIFILGLGLFMIVFTPALQRRRLRLGFERLNQEHLRSDLDSRQKLLVTEKGLRVKSAIGESDYNWSAVTKVEATSSHIFIFLLGSLIVVPSRALPDGHNAILLDTIQRFRQSATA